MRESVHRAFAGERDLSDVERHTNESVARAFGREPERQVTGNELPIQKRDFSAVAVWAAKEAAATATRALSQAIMRADGNKGIYAAEAEAQAIAEESYALAAKRSPYEDVRHEAVARALTKLADTCERRAEESKRQPRKAAPKAAQQPQAAPRHQQESLSPRRRVQISEQATRGNVRAVK
ncbi:hypothetical protein GU243_06130 [Pseudarthrobacter psychrotolerans]|uniref:Uncharacterized protein n=1 Tax=Pseudarthrobacter psychrotolerans TaxID=2697569 RepID=A0A6P1NLN8_9MICC|nr:hypothetical protein [Pseudarthrobacter psychrotolerans]QHK19390.1 hypothetical protein GU243_06130 [Pseudarthrobacter psychrotolerans]